jgi:prolyl-tRNA editing enzyme YbaK/EbsC (Cys-tRNA(Pro) deacylase)
MSVASFIERSSLLKVEVEVTEMSESTHTAADAATAVGCPVAAIVKSLLVIAGDEPLLLLVSGPNRVDLGRVSAALGVTVAMADAKSVKSITGYSIGGVPPFGHASIIRTIIDADLLELDEVWAAAGSSRAVFPIAPAHLVELTSAVVLLVS